MAKSLENNGSSSEMEGNSDIDTTNTSTAETSETSSSSGNEENNNTDGESTNTSTAETSETSSSSTDDDTKAKNAAKSTKGGDDDTRTSSLLGVGKKIKTLTKSAQLALWNVKYARFSAEDLQQELTNLRKSGAEGITDFLTGLLNKKAAEQQAAGEIILAANAAKRKARLAAEAAEKKRIQDAADRRARLKKWENAETARIEAEKIRLAQEAADKKKAEEDAAAELAQAEENARIIAAELAKKKAEEEAAALAIIKAAADEAKRIADEIEAKRIAAELAAVTEAQRIRNNRIRRLLNQGIVVFNGYTLETFDERMRFLDDEFTRRSNEDERRIAIDALIAAEPQTKLDFDAHAVLLQSEFDLLMQEKYPWFVRELNTTPAERKQKAKELKIEKERLELVWETRRAQNQKNYDAELARKAVEAQLKWQKLRDEEQQDIFEDVVADDEIEIREENSDSNNMTDIEKAKKAIADLESRLGKSIVPHRDMIESTDSDFDHESQLNPDDILIRDDMETDSGLTIERQIELLELKESMESADVEEFYITGKNASSKMRTAIDTVTDVFNTPSFGTVAKPVSNKNKVSKLKLEESMKFIRANIRGAGAKHEYFLQNKIGNVRQAELILLNSVLENPSTTIPDSTQFDSVRGELRQLKTLMGI